MNKFTLNKELFLIVVATMMVLLGMVAIYLSPSPFTLTKTDVQTRNLSRQSTSDETSVLEKDVLGTDLSDIDKELQQIESELFGN